MEIDQKKSEVIDEEALTKGYRQISDVLKFIQEVAAQTNLLALNASIQSSKVGEMGKGFNVIAQEIRKLSEASKESVEKIQQSLYDIEAEAKSIIKLKEAYESEKYLLDALLHSSEDRIFFKDLDLKFTRVSNSTLQYHKRVHGVNSLIGKSDFDFYPEEEAKIYSDAEKEILKGGSKTNDHINSETLPDGSVNYYLTIKFPLYDTNGKLCGLFGISKNITELQKKLQERPTHEPA